LKPVHGICNGPICMSGLYDLSKYFSEIGAPYIRLHDTEGAEGRYLVDISRIFPNFDADETNPENYYFHHTDRLITAIENLKAKTIYRLGESIDHTVYKRHARPPKDFEKWARICLHIIKHYNDGWANGFHYGLKFWEIWNEPDVTEQMWNGGTYKQYYDLYRIAARAIKEYDNSLLIGGPTMAWDLNGLAKEFVKLCKNEDLPLDFFSYHMYTDSLESLVQRTADVKTLLLENGFDKTLLVIDEWNYFGSDKYARDELWRVARSVEDAVDAKELYDKQKMKLVHPCCRLFLCHERNARRYCDIL